MTSTTATLAGTHFYRGMSTAALIDAAGCIGVSEQTVRKIACSLYEAGYISYPHNASEVVPAREAARIPEVLDAIAEFAPLLLQNAPIEATPDFFVDDFVWAHHAIIPLAKNGMQAVPLRRLHEMAEAIYILIASAYLTRVMPSRTVAGR